MPKDYYQILDVSKTASLEEIKAAFRRKAHQHHPDKGGDEIVFKEIVEAYQILANPAKRLQYDRSGSSAFANQGFAATNMTWDEFKHKADNNYDTIIDELIDDGLEVVDDLWQKIITKF